jgi:hypothetical protein
VGCRTPPALTTSVLATEGPSNESTNVDFLCLLLTATACGAGAPAPVSPVAASTTTHGMAASVQPPYIRAAVDAADRDGGDDKALDAGRHPAALLDFCDVRPGGGVAEIAAGRGYTAELASRVVGARTSGRGRPRLRGEDKFAGAAFPGAAVPRARAS